MLENEITLTQYMNRYGQRPSQIGRSFEVVLLNGKAVYADWLQPYSMDTKIGWQGGDWVVIATNTIDHVQS